MKNLKPLFIILLGFLFMNCSSPSAIHVGDWERLGSRKVNYSADRDEILVTAREGRFNKLKLKFRDARLNMKRLVVHYGNGDKQEFNLKNTFRAGQESRVLDLRGGNRVIRKVVLRYDTKNLARKRATVEVWARH